MDDPKDKQIVVQVVKYNKYKGKLFESKTYHVLQKQKGLKQGSPKRLFVLPY